MSKAPTRAEASSVELDRRAEVIAEAQAEIDRALTRLDAERAQLAEDRTRFERERTELLDQLEQAREHARRAADAMIALESIRARETAELDEVRRDLAAVETSATARKRVEELYQELVDAHEVIHSMQRTRAWRIGSAWWRLRDRLTGRRRNLDSRS